MSLGFVVACVTVVALGTIDRSTRVLYAPRIYFLHFVADLFLIADDERSSQHWPFNAVVQAVYLLPYVAVGIGVFALFVTWKSPNQRLQLTGDARE
ncbi:MAG: hypothetical protein AAFY08_07390 [Planctomycetota bacterium]